MDNGTTGTPKLSGLGVLALCGWTMVFRVGDSVQVYWSDEGWVKGVIDKTSKEKGLHVLYEDGDKEWISNDDLDQEGDQLIRHTKGERRKKVKTKKRKAGKANHACDIDGCTYVAKKADHFRKHQVLVHGVDVVFFPCNQDGCDYRSTIVSSVRRHLAGVHDIGVKWHECDHKGCDYKAKQAGHWRQHQAHVHGFDVVFYPCNQDGCDYKATIPGSVTRHRAYVHDIGVKWHECDQKDCSYKAKQPGDLRRHQSRVHRL